MKRIRPFYESDLIKLLIGIRRSGKSVLLRQIEAELIKGGVDPLQIISLNFEDLSYSFIKSETDLNQSFYGYSHKNYIK